MVAGAAVALAVLAPTVARAEVPGYTLTAPVCAKGEFDGHRSFQVGELNNKGQFTFNMVGTGERLYVWDGSKVVKVTDETFKAPDGAAFSTGNVYSPHGLNDAGKVAFVGDVVDGTGVHYILVYDLATVQYTLVARPELPAPGGDEYVDLEAALGASHRILARINNQNQVVWNLAVPGADGEPHNSIFMYDLATQQATAILRPGTLAPDGKAFDHAWTPDINDQGQVTFVASTEGSEQFGVYLWDKGTITAIAAPGTKIGDLTIDQTSYARIANNGDVVLIAQFGEGHTPLGEGMTADTAVLLYTAADKKLQALLKPGDPLLDGQVFQGIEADRAPVDINSRGQVAITAVNEEDQGGVYLWQNGQLQSLARYDETLTGIGKVTGLSRRTADAAGAAWSGRHLSLNENGDVAFTAQIDGISCFILATAPRPETPPAAGE
jgi:hypothetical protein